MHYEDANIEIVLFQTEDVICTSSGTDDSTDNWGKEDWDN